MHSLFFFKSETFAISMRQSHISSKTADDYLIYHLLQKPTIAGECTKSKLLENLVCI